MTIITEIGEAGVTVDGHEFVFRPTLANIARIGTPREIVDAFVCLYARPDLTPHEWRNRQIVAEHWRRQIEWAATILYACCDDPDVGRLVGSVHPPRRYAPGLLPAEAMVAIARQLIRHGVVGDVKKENTSGEKGEYQSEFKAAELAAFAQAHLGVSTAEAWGMTVTSIVQALQAKYPPPKEKGGPPMTEERNAQAMNWLDKINEQRKRRAAHG